MAWMIGRAAAMADPDAARRKALEKLQALADLDDPESLVVPILVLEGDLDRYYQQNVIGGPGAFVIAAKDFETFGEAILKKLIAEIAGVDLVVVAEHATSLQGEAAAARE